MIGQIDMEEMTRRYGEEEAVRLMGEVMKNNKEIIKTQKLLGKLVVVIEEKRQQENREMERRREREQEETDRWMEECRKKNEKEREEKEEEKRVNEEWRRIEKMRVWEEWRQQEIREKRRKVNSIRHGSHWGRSLQNGLGDEQTCGTTLASAYVLCCLSATWSQLQIKERKSEWK